MQEFDKKNPQTSFGAFKPVGNVVAVFNDVNNAMKAQADLVSGGDEEMELTFMKGDEFIALLDELNGEESVLAVLGSELRKTDEFRKHAEGGACFLIAFAPSDKQTQHVVSTIGRHDYVFALKYGHMMIQRFDPEHTTV